MPKFRKKPVVVEAEQWFPGKQIEGVRLPFGTLKPQILYSRDRRFYYIQTAGIWPEFWLGVEKHPGPATEEQKQKAEGYFAPCLLEIRRTDTGEVYHRTHLDFRIWDLKSFKDESGRTATEDIDPESDLYKDYLVAARKVPDEKQRGYIDTLEGKMEVAPGDWVITGVKGERYPCKDDIFRLTYEEVE